MANNSVRCYTAGCNDADPNNGPICNRCWKHLQPAERHIIKKKYNDDCAHRRYLPSIQRICAIKSCYNPVALKGQEDGRCRKCRVDGMMPTALAGEEEEAAAAGVEQTQALRTRSRSPRLTALLDTLHADLDNLKASTDNLQAEYGDLRHHANALSAYNNP